MQVEVDCERIPGGGRRAMIMGAGPRWQAGPVEPAGANRKNNEFHKIRLVLVGVLMRLAGR